MRDYRQLLDRADIGAVLIATPMGADVAGVKRLAAAKAEKSKTIQFGVQ